MIAKDQLKSFVERIERLEEEKKELSDDIRDVYAEAKGNGFDVKALREIIRLRKQDADERAEHDRRAVLLAHIANPAGLTDFELAEIVGRQQTSAGKRRGELRDVAMIEQTDERRPAPSGSMAIVWRVTPMGREAAEGAA